MPDSAILSVWDAMAEMIRAGGAPPNDSKGNPLLAGRRVYRGQTTPGVQEPPLSYFLLWAPLGEDEGPFYSEAGQEGAYRFGAWSDTPDNAIKCYRWFKQLAHGEAPVVDGHALWQPFSVRFITLQPDQKRTAWQAIGEVLAQTDEGM
jgi:hypothetical protein